MRRNGFMSNSPLAIIRLAASAGSSGARIRRSKISRACESITLSARPGSWNQRMYMRSSLPLTIARMTEVGGIAMYGVHTPTTPAVRSGYSTGIAHATKPPQSCPTKICALDLQLVEQSRHVSRQLGKAVVSDRCGRTRLRIAPLIGSDRAKARRRDRRQLMPPRVGKLRKPMAKHDRGPLAGFVNRKAYRWLIRPRRNLHRAALGPVQSGHIESASRF